MNVALVHDWLNQLGGAEDVLQVLNAIFPRAPIFTSIYDRRRMPSAWRSWDIRSTWMDRLPGVHRYHQPYMPVFAWVWAHRRIPAAYELILSNKSAFCIAARSLRPDALHVCYCLTPTRFTYEFNAYAKRERIPRGATAILRALSRYLCRWETGVAQRITAFIAISREVQQRIRKYYGRDSVIIYPPVAMPPRAQAMQGQQDQGFYLIVSRLLPYKRIDLAIEAFGKLKLPLVIAGDGRDRRRLEQLAARHSGDNIRLLGRVDEATLHRLLTECRAFVFPGIEDFGIAPIRAMAYGKPVIAYAGGGALDYVIEGVTGTFFDRHVPEALAEAVLRSSGVTFAPAEIRRHAEQFSVERFVREISAFLRGLGVEFEMSDEPVPAS
ncbi:MAG: glycosyltransferase [Thermoflexales bacterium]|nr:glycosyltransferase [Thermoflexales bacterium]MDW8351333.1 glycosyltransferase [Anaerolineae bacterium]